MKVLLVGSEVTPFIKIGGLGDVMGSLPKALRELNVGADVIVPFFSYAHVDMSKAYKTFELFVPYAGTTHAVNVYKTKLPHSDVDVYLLQNNAYFGEAKSHYYARNERELDTFAFFSRAVVEFIKASLNPYDVVHCNDWHTGMLPHLLEEELGAERPGTLFTIHNLMYQGVGDPARLKDLGLNAGAHPLLNWDIEDGDLNFLQQGISSADYVNTVSPSYADEITKDSEGGVLRDILENRSGRLSGILNGIDYTQFPRDFNLKNWVVAKKAHKEKLLSKLGLIGQPEAPLMCYIGRIDSYQKGIALIYDALLALSAKGVKFNFVLLGKGDVVWEEKMSELAKSSELRGQVSINILFDAKLAEEVYKASDFILIPSKYEPCGLIQMLAMWYGCLPIAHFTGGLKDSIKSDVTGFLFNAFTAAEFTKSIENAVEVYQKQPDYYRKMVLNALNEDFRWDTSAREYLKLYERLVKSIKI